MGARDSLPLETGLESRTNVPESWRSGTLPIMQSLLLAAALTIANPCISARPECTEWIAAKGEPSKLLVYRSYSLAIRNERIARALVFVHGINRDADNHFRTALAAAFLAGTLDDTEIVAPRFASNSDAPGNEAGCQRRPETAHLWRLKIAHF
jgi:hypothetical protein